MNCTQCEKPIERTITVSFAPGQNIDRSSIWEGDGNFCRISCRNRFRRGGKPRNTWNQSDGKKREPIWLRMLNKRKAKIIMENVKIELQRGIDKVGEFISQ